MVETVPVVVVLVLSLGVGVLTFFCMYFCLKDFRFKSSFFISGWSGVGGVLSEEVEVGSEENPRSGRADAAWLAKRGMVEVVEENPPAYLKVEHPLDNARKVAMLLIEKCQELGGEKKGYGT